MWRRLVRTVRSHLVTVALSLLVTNAAAVPCGRPDVLETFPSNGATDVPVNARLAAHYASTAEYVDEEVALEHVGVAVKNPRATFDPGEGILSFQPAEALVAGDSYIVRWPPLRGLTTAVVGKGAEVTFTAGSVADVDSPLFGGVSTITWDVARVNDDCTGALEDRFVFDLGLYDATDDGGRGMLTLLVFQSKGGSATTSPAPVLAQRFSDSPADVRVQRSIDSAAGDVCFAALARDAAGRVSNSADREVCVSTVRPPFFYGCALARGRSRAPGAAVPASIALLVFACAWRRARDRGRRRA
jgi:hypothetical protein